MLDAAIRRWAWPSPSWGKANYLIAFIKNWIINKIGG